jgi:hypothetical protein
MVSTCRSSPPAAQTAQPVQWKGWFSPFAVLASSRQVEHLLSTASQSAHTPQTKYIPAHPGAPLHHLRLRWRHIHKPSYPRCCLNPHTLPSIRADPNDHKTGLAHPRPFLDDVCQLRHHTNPLHHQLQLGSKIKAIIPVRTTHQLTQGHLFTVCVSSGLWRSDLSDNRHESDLQASSSCV